MQAFIVALYAYGFIVSGIFCVTWYPLALRAWAQHRKGVSLLRIFDYAGVQLAIFLTFGLLLRNFWVFGVADPKDWLSSLARFALPVTLDVMVSLRLYKWWRVLHAQRHRGPDQIDPFVGVSASREDQRPPV